ncbi:hypothetical protein QBC37DRAFT_425747 [Rhypophila decipiens]|uniref:DUF7907 domain-containing protein n=1 Tax=Rhypophila decipiens TaxID=261697 RepID=A0AAN6Y3I5_9PEZI|nr:hypothetical protein QBC37DRAFT_425747 [Rhypophila decipiens]
MTSTLLTFTTALAALASTISATPIQSPYSPELPLSSSYRLYINRTTDLDFSTNPLNGQYLTAVRAGATLNAPTITNLSSDAAIFSTTTHQTTQLSRTLSANYTFAPFSIFMSDAATPVALNPHVLNLGINAGNGTEGVYPSGNVCTSMATPKVGTFAVCDQVFDAYTHPRWLVVFIEGGEENLPSGGECVPVNLVPECDAYDPLAGTDGEGRVAETRCWTDVKSVADWAAYGC